MRVVKSLNDSGANWTPGKINGESVTVKMTLPIKFTLSAGKAAPAKIKETDVESHKVVVHGKEIIADGQSYKVVEDMPLFPGCDDTECSQSKLIGYVIENLKYPEAARAEKVEGQVVVTFVIEPNGIVSSIKVMKGLNAVCNAEVIRVIESMNSMPEQWTPGMHKGQKVRVEFALPVIFKL